MKHKGIQIQTINTKEEYNFCVSKGHDPLLSPYLIMNHKLRVDVQRELFNKVEFGRGNIVNANQRFYIWVWNHKVQICENCFKPLHNYSATFISHILTKGAHPAISTDPRNTNILCGKCHNLWEFGERKKMLIYISNVKVIRLLKKEYQL